MHRIIEVEANVAGSGEPVTFDLDGRTFTRLAFVPKGALLGVVDISRETDVFRRAQLLVDFVASWLVPEDREAWRQAVLSLPDFSPLDTVAEYLIESLAPVPTSARSSSAAKPSKDGTSTRAAGRGSRQSR